jgi:predicted AAA+ superfamily ATPase
MLQQLVIENSWWETGSVPELLNPPIKRNKYDSIVKRFDDNRITAIIGPRRVGKSTLMYQLIDYLLKSVRVPAKRICFMSLENPLLSFDEALNIYLSEILNEPLRALKERIYLFIDEIHFWNEWNRRLKRIIDLKLPVKIIVSGSSATHLAKGSVETLSGRITEEYVYPLDFCEFVKFSDPALYQKLAFLNKINIFSSGGNGLLSKRSEIIIHKDRLYTLFQTFRKKGGFIPYINLEFPEYHRLIRSDIIEKTIYKDLSIAYNFRSPLSLEKLLTHISIHSGELLNYQNISKEYGMSLPSVEKYIKYLELAHFAGTVKNILPSGRPALKSYLKAYISDLSIKRVLARGIEDEGFEVETIIFNNLYRKSLENQWNIYYWRYQNDEIDIVIKPESGVIPVEVKFRKDIKGVELTDIQKFMESFDCHTGYVITREDLKIKEMNGKRIIYMPAYLLW